MEGRQKAFKLCLSAFPRAKGNAFWFFPSRCLWVYVISEESALCTWTPCPASGGGWSVSEGCPRNMHAEEEPAWAWEVTAGKSSPGNPTQSRTLLSRLQVPLTFHALKPLTRNRQQHITLTVRVELPLPFWNIRGRNNWGGVTLPICQVVSGSRTSWYLLREPAERVLT